MCQFVVNVSICCQCVNLCSSIVQVVNAGVIDDVLDEENPIPQHDDDYFLQPNAPISLTADVYLLGFRRGYYRGRCGACYTLIDTYLLVSYSGLAIDRLQAFIQRIYI